MIEPDFLSPKSSLWNVRLLEQRAAPWLVGPPSSLASSDPSSLDGLGDLLTWVLVGVLVGLAILYLIRGGQRAGSDSHNVQEIHGEVLP